MRRLQPLNIKIVHLWDSSSSSSSSDDDDDDDDDIEILNNNPISLSKPTTTTNQLNESSTRVLPSINNNINMNRLSLLPAFPSLHQHGVVVYRNREHLLLANIPRMYY